MYTLDLPERDILIFAANDFHIDLANVEHVEMYSNNRGRLYAHIWDRASDFIDECVSDDFRKCTPE